MLARLPASVTTISFQLCLLCRDKHLLYRRKMTIVEPMVETAAEPVLHGPAPAPVATGREGRTDIVGPAVPEAPFPILLAGEVQRGFGRGGKDLGCPTGEQIAFPYTYHLMFSLPYS